MRVRLTLTLLILLIAVLITAVPTDAQAPDPAAGPDAAAWRVARPRAAVLTVFHSAAESFLLPQRSSAEAPIGVPSRADGIHLSADYEAVMMPLTAGWARYRLAAYRIVDGEEELLDEAGAEVVTFGPARRAGRLMVRLPLRPGLHQIRIVATTSARAVGVAEWTTDRDAVTVWVLVAGGTTRATPQPGSPAPNPTPPSIRPFPAAFAPGGAVPGVALQQADPDPAVLPVGGLSVGAHRGVLGADAVGAVNFETGHNRTLVVHVGQPVSVWSNYELWLARDTRGEAGVALTVSPRVTDNASEVAPLARDAFAFEDGSGPRLEDGTLRVSFDFARPGLYELQARLDTGVRSGDMAAADRDNVPFRVRVVEQQPRTGAIAGVVHGEDGIALEGVLLEATTANGASAGRARTNARGMYRIEDLEPGAYLVHASPGDLNYLDEWWQDSPTIHDADRVPVHAGQVTEGIDFRLTPGGTITGRVTDRDGRGIGGIEITVGPLRSASGAPGQSQPPDPSVPEPDLTALARTKTNDEGYYSLDRLRAWAYWVRASDPGGRYLAEYFDDKTYVRPGRQGLGEGRRGNRRHRLRAVVRRRDRRAGARADGADRDPAAAGHRGGGAPGRGARSGDRPLRDQPRGSLHHRWAGGRPLPGARRRSGRWATWTSGTKRPKRPTTRGRCRSSRARPPSRSTSRSRRSRTTRAWSSTRATVP